MQEPAYLTTAEAIAFLDSTGLHVAPTYFKKITAPSINQGPRAAGFFGNRKLYERQELLRWGRSRIQTPEHGVARFQAANAKSRAARAA